MPANRFFDSGANYSFITRKFGRRLTFPIDRLENVLIIEVASGKFVHVSNPMKNIVTDLIGNTFHEELLHIELNGFKIVLGLDLICVNDADNNCRKKIMKINSPRRETFMLYRKECKVYS